MSIVRARIEALEVRLQLNAPGVNWTPVFVDEFNGTSLDTSKWSMYLPWSNSVSGDNRYHNAGGNYLSYMMPDDISFPGDGTIKLTTQKRDVTSANGTVFHYTEGMITTASRFTASYGYYEVRAKLPTGAGNWPAFWMTNGWPPEDDIMEAWPAQPRSHQGLYGMDSGWHDYNAGSSGYPSTNWHTFGMEWGPGYQKFYIDDQLKLSISGSYVPSTSNPQYMLLNSGVQNGQTGGYSNSNNNALLVDYVRVYSYNASPGPAIANPTWNTTGNWNFTSSNAFIVTGGTIGRTGTGDLHIEGAGEAYQTITGLSPNTSYTFSGYGIIDPNYGTTPGLIGVRNYGGNEISNTIGASGSWSQGAVTFTTGPANTSATIFVRNPNGNRVYFDDLYFEKTPTVNPIADQHIAQNATTSVPVSVSNAGSASGVLTFSASSNNSTLFPPGSMSFIGNGNNRTLRLTPATNQSGSADVTVTVSDIFGSVSARTFNVSTAVVVNGDRNSANEDDSIRVVRNGSNLDVYVNNTTATPTQSYDFASMGALALNGLGGDDTITLDFSGGNVVPAGGLSIDAGAHTRGDSLIIRGADSDDSASIGQGTVTLNGGNINYTNVEDVSLDLAGGSNSLGSSGPTMSTHLSLGVTGGSLLLQTALPSTTDLSISGGRLDLGGITQTIDALSGDGVVMLGSANLSVGNDNGSGTFNGSIQGSGGLYKAGASTFTIGAGASNSFTGPTSVNAGTLRLDGSIASSSAVSVGPGATLLIGATQRINSTTLADGSQLRLLVGGDKVLSIAGSLSVSATAKLDLADDALIVDYDQGASSPLPQITSAIVTGRAGGNWNGNGIFSSVAVGDPTRSVGVGEASMLGIDNFFGQPVDSSAVLVAFTYAGDANLDRVVDVSDLGRLATAWQTSSNWMGGDFNYDGFVDVSDLGALATNWQASSLSTTQSTATPRIISVSQEKSASLNSAPAAMPPANAASTRRRPVPLVASLQL